MIISGLIVFSTINFVRSTIKSDQTALVAGLLVGLHPISVWYSGMAMLPFISGGIFYLGALCVLYPPKKLNLCLIVGASMLLYSVFLNSDLWPLLVLLYLFLIFNSLSDDFKSEGRSFFTLWGLCTCFCSCDLTFRNLWSFLEMILHRHLH